MAEYKNVDNFPGYEPEVCMLSTKDNPFNPWTQWEQWYSWDTAHGYDSCGYLARIAHIHPSMSGYQIAVENEYAINEIIANDVTNNYIKVLKP